MATPAPSAKPSVVTVQRGDCLWNIARDYLGNPYKYTDLAKLNNISNPRLIYTGQKIKLTGSASTSSSSSSSSTNSTKAKITSFGILASESKDTLFAVWSWDQHSKTEEYSYKWEYTIPETGDRWWSGSSGTVKVLESTYTVPKNAMLVRFSVQPISKKYDVTEGTGNNKKTVTKTHFEASWAFSETFNASNKIKPDAPGQPSIELIEPDKNTLRAELTNIDVSTLEATAIEFQIVKNNTSQFGAVSSGSINASLNRVSYTSGKLDPGAEYTVRCRSVRGSLKSEWSLYSESVTTAPSKPSGFTKCEAKSSSTDGKVSVYLEWKPVPSAETYDIEYATNINYFDGSDQTHPINGIKLTHYETYSLETGSAYYFRYRAVNSGGESDWSAVSSVILGEPPAAPTTWSSTTTAAVGGPLNLYWVHNAKDGSSQTWAQLALEIYRPNGLDADGNTKYELLWSKEEEIKNSTNVEEKDKTSSFDATDYLQEQIPTYYKEGVQLRWRVRTSGVTNELGDWSIVRMVDIYAEPTVTLEVRDATNTINTTFNTLGSFPIYISATTQPQTQAPIGFHLTIVSNDSYETVDNVGNDKMVSVGEQVYSKYFDVDTDLSTELSAGDVDLESGVSYTLTCVAAMNSGLTAEKSLSFTVSWVDVSYTPNAIVQYDADLITTNIRPFCELYTTTFQGVTYDSETDTYISTGTDISVVEGYPLELMYTDSGYRVYSEMVEGGDMVYYYINKRGAHVNVTESQITRREYATTTTGEQVYSGSTAVSIDADGNVTGGETVLYHQVQVGTPVEGVSLAVYRREFDGSYTELARDIDNTKNTYITDPHPALDYARYRIVATTDSTGAVSYYDMPGFPIMEKAVIIQWNEDWTNFDVADNTMPAQPPWSGSRLRLPYNIDVSDNYGVDVSLVAYAGRKRPVTYYGTQLGETSTWNTTIPKDDEETLYALRRLAIWTGDCYVREPSGTGYWANVTVSFSQKHLDMTIPVTLNIKRVEGGA